MLRDQQVTAELLKNNWKVLRFWGKEIEKNIDFCIGKIIKAIEERKHGQLH
jgi:DNA mismatch endonuclease (patch repair protein)